MESVPEPVVPGEEEHHHETGIEVDRDRQISRMALCSGRLYPAALRSFLIGPGLRHRIQTLHEADFLWVAMRSSTLIRRSTMPLESAQKAVERSSGVG